MNPKLIAPPTEIQVPHLINNDQRRVGVRLEGLVPPSASNVG